MRYLFSLLVAMGVVFGLFLVMEQLVKGARWKPENGIDTIPIEFVRVKHEKPVEARRRSIPEKPPEDTAKPEPPRAKLEQALTPPGGGEIDVAAPELDAGRGKLSGFSAGSVFDSQTSALIALAQVAPEYPFQAKKDGIEGWVLFELTVTEFGTVEDVRVLDSRPKGVFEAVGLRAIARWKFKPTYENGVAVRTPKRRYKMDFVLSKEGSQ